MDGLKWMTGLEDQDSVDTKEVKSETDVDDVEQTDLTEDTAEGDKGKEEIVVSEVDISLEEEGNGDISGEKASKTIEAFHIDEKCGAAKRFVISGYDASTNTAAEVGDDKLQTVLLMQNGTIQEVGLNGITCEDLLKVIEEMYIGFQSGQFACDENEKVLFHVRAAQSAILSRFNRRTEEGTEGTHTGS